MEKRIVEVTEERRGEEGLVTTLFFKRGLVIRGDGGERRFFQVDVSSKRIKTKEYYETMAFGRAEKNTVLCQNTVLTEGEMRQTHWKVCREYKEGYLKQPQPAPLDEPVF